MRRVWLGIILIMIIGVPKLGLTQWLRYPTEGVPRTADGKPDLKSPAPRLPDGKPDFSGLWHAANPNRCVPGVGQFVACGTEIGGSEAGARRVAPQARSPTG